MRLAPALLAALAVAILAAPREASAEDADSCIRYTAEVRYGAMGYNHLVRLTNSCSVAADCLVSTDVAPEPVRAAVGPRSEVVVNTFLGSPARTFVPHVQCTMRR